MIEGEMLFSVVFAFLNGNSSYVLKDHNTIQHFGTLQRVTWKIEKVQNIDVCLFRWLSKRQYNRSFYVQYLPILRDCIPLSYQQQKNLRLLNCSIYVRLLKYTISIYNTINILKCHQNHLKVNFVNSTWINVFSLA